MIEQDATILDVNRLLSARGIKKKIVVPCSTGAALLACADPDVVVADPGYAGLVQAMYRAGYREIDPKTRSDLESPNDLDDDFQAIWRAINKLRDFSKISYQSISPWSLVDRCIEAAAVADLALLALDRVLAKDRSA